MKNKKGFSALAIVVVIATIGIIGALAWAFINKSTKVDTTSILKPEEFTAKVVSELSKKYKMIESTEDILPDVDAGSISYRHMIHSENGKDNATNNKYIDGWGPIYKLEGYSFYSTASEGSSLNFNIRRKDEIDQAYGFKDRDNKVSNAIRNLFKDLSMSKASIELHTIGPYEVYIGRGLICEISRWNEADVSCAPILSYEKMAKQLQDFDNVLPTKFKTDENGSKQMYILHYFIVKDTKIPGYKVARGDVSWPNGDVSSEHALLFYKNKDNQWFNLAVGPNGEGTCQSLANAIEGTQCIDDDNNNYSGTWTGALEPTIWF